MSFGPPERSRSLTRTWLAAALVGLVVGLVLGLVPDWRGDASDGVSAPDLPGFDIQAGAVETTDELGGHGPEFALRLLNRGDEDVTVTGLRFEQLPTDLVDFEPAVLRPGAWGSLHFAAPPDCFTGVPAALSTARLTLQEDGERYGRTVEVAGEGRRLLDYQQALCASGGPARPDDLIGMWMLDDTFSSSDLEGALLWRFHRDGTFVADPEGLMFLDEQRAVEGRYSLRRGRLVTDVHSGYACSRGDRAVWRATMMSTAPDRVPLMALAWQGGRCPTEAPSVAWVLRRIVDGTDTPGAVG